MSKWKAEAFKRLFHSFRNVKFLNVEKGAAVRMTNKIELPINKNPMIKGYSHSLNLFSILENKDHAGDLFATLSKINHYKFREHFHRIERKINNETSDFIIDPYSTCGTYVMLLDQVNAPEMELHIEYMQNIHHWSSILLFVTKADNELNRKNEGWIFKYAIGMNSLSGKVYNDGQDKDIIYKKANDVDADFSGDDKNSFKIEIDDNINAYYMNNEKWELAFSAKNEYKDNAGDYIIGIAILPYEIHVYNWIFTNYMQLVFDLGVKRLDYFLGYQRLFDYIPFSPFIPIISYEFDDFKEIVSSDGFINCMISHISKGFYVAMELDEFYLPARRFYKKYNYCHSNLIYGFDLNDSTFDLLGYDSYPIYSKVSFDEFILAIDYEGKLNNKISFLKFQENFNYYEFNLPLMIDFLKEYIDSSNSGHRNDYFIRNNEAEAEYGLNIIKKFIDEPDMYMALINAREICYTIAEHKEVMKKRIEFLYKRNILNIQEYDYFLNQFDEIHKISKVILTKIMYKIIKKEEYCDVKALLQSLYEKENKAIRALISVLELQL